MKTVGKIVVGVTIANIASCALALAAMQNEKVVKWYTKKLTKVTQQAMEEFEEMF